MTKPKETVKKIYLPVFTYTINVIVTSDIELSRNSRDKEIGHSYKTDGKLYGLHSWNVNKPCCYLFFYHKATLNEITHECYHAISRMFNWIGAEKEEELFAYHLGYLTENVCKIIYNKK